MEPLCTRAHACWNARKCEKGKAVAWVKEEQQIARLTLEGRSPGYRFLVEPGWISALRPAELELKESLHHADSKPKFKRLQGLRGQLTQQIVLGASKQGEEVNYSTQFPHPLVT